MMKSKSPVEQRHRNKLSPAQAQASRRSRATTSDHEDMMNTKRFSARDTVEKAHEAHSKALDVAAHLENFEDKVQVLEAANSALKQKLERAKMETLEVMQEAEFTRYYHFYRWRDVVAASYRKRKFSSKVSVMELDRDAVISERDTWHDHVGEAVRERKKLVKEKESLEKDCESLKEQLALLEEEERQLTEVADENELWINTMQKNAAEMASATISGGGAGLVEDVGGSGVDPDRAPAQSTRMRTASSSAAKISLLQASQAKAGLTNCLHLLDELNKKRHSEVRVAEESSAAASSPLVSPTTPPDNSRSVPVPGANCGRAMVFKTAGGPGLNAGFVQLPQPTAISFHPTPLLGDRTIKVSNIMKRTYGATALGS
mmetsp:Transcript_18037/g.45122  ORF Transcript_18037/g.45122 Transcript_18037/m.45122 type:complete len:374 (-) Transcript_18037:366-1487(-)|eukprot:g13806.t1